MVHVIICSCDLIILIALPILSWCMLFFLFFFVLSILHCYSYPTFDPCHGVTFLKPNSTSITIFIHQIGTVCITKTPKGLTICILGDPTHSNQNSQMIICNEQSQQDELKKFCIMSFVPHTSQMGSWVVSTLKEKTMLFNINPCFKLLKHA